MSPSRLFPAHVRQSVSFLVTLLFFNLIINQVSQAQGPCNAHRYQAGDGWRYNTSTNKWEAKGPVNGNDEPLGIVACGSSASTENHIENFQHPYDPSQFNISPSCFPGPTVTASIPTNQKVVWFNFDIRPFAGTFQFQLESSGGPDVRWAAYYVDAAHSGPPGANTSTGKYPEFVSDPNNSKNLSGDCANQTLTYATCGTSFNGWATLTVPSFAKPANYYLAVWSSDGKDMNTNIIFKSRFGCGGATCDLEKDGTSSISCNSNTTYKVCQNFFGGQGKWQIVDNATPKATSYTVSLFKSDGTPVGTTTTSNTAPSFILGVIPDGAVKATICATYALGQNYDISLVPDPNYTVNLGGNTEYIQCTSTASFSGTGPAAVIANAGDDFSKTCTAFLSGKQIGEASAVGFTYTWLPVTGLSASNISNPNANPTATTTYTVTKTNTATGCSDDDQVIVTVNNTAVIAEAGDGFTKTCTAFLSGKQIGEAPVSGFTYSWTPAAGLSATNVSNPTANPTVTTTYTVRKTNTETGCYAEDQVTVTVNTTAVLAAAGDDFTKTCVLNPTGKQIGEAPVSGFTYSWTPAAGLSATNVSNPTANPTVTTTYTVRKTNTETGCYAEDQVTVTVNTTAVLAAAGDDFTKTCVLNPTGKQIGEAPVSGFTYSWTPAAGLSATNVSNPTANPTVTTTYTVRKTNTETGCYAEDEVIVTVNTTQVFANAGNDFTKTCVLNPDGKQIGEESQDGFTYSWSPAAGLNATNVGNPTANPTVTTTYTVRKTNTETGCYDEDEVIVTVNTTQVVANAGNDFTKTCVLNPDGKQIGEASVAGFTYSWSPAAGLSATNVSNPTANPTVTTTYTVRKTNTETGCYDEDEVIVTVNTTQVVANAGDDFTKTCVLNPTGKQIGEAPVSGFTYSWTPAAGLSATNVSNPTANPTVTTTYTVRKTNTETGCYDEDEVIVTVNTTPVVANAGDDFTKTCVLNPTGKQIGEAPVSSFTYSWTPAAGLSATNVSNPTANPTVTTTYTVRKTNTETGCYDEDEVIVTVNTTAVVANAGDDFTKTCVLNPTGKQIGEAPVSGFTYSWSPAAGLSATNVSNPTANPTVTTTYTVRKTNTETGCYDEDEVIVTVNTTPVVANAGDDFTKTCVLNPTGKQIGEASVAGFTYSWTPSTGLSADDISNPTANPAVTTTYTVRKTNTETGCYDEDEVIVTVNTTPVVANAGDDFTKTCVLNPTGKQIGEASVAGFTYSWSPAAGLSATNVSNPTANPTVTTTYTVRKTNTETGCYDEDEVIVTVNTTPVVANAGDDFTKTCVLNPDGKQIGETAVSGFTYSWTPAAGLSATNVGNPTANPTVTTTYTVRKTNTETGCYDEDEVIVTVNTTAVVANAGDDFTKTCVLNPTGKQIGEASVAGFTYSWLPAAGLSATNVSNPTANPTVTTTYTVRKTNTETGCYDEDEVIVTVNTTPVVANAGDDFTKTCVLNPDGKQIGEVPVSGFTYSWSPATGLSATNVSNPTANPTVTTTYTVRKTNTETGCYDEDEVIVTVNTTAVVANAGDDFTKTCVLNPAGKQIGEAPVSGFTYSWSPAAGLSATNVSNPTANPTVTTTYTVRKTNTETGCYDEDEVIVTVNTTAVVANAGDDFTKTCVLNPDGKQIGETAVSGFTYSWSPAAGLSATNVSNPTANPTVTTTYTVRKTNTETGCYDEDEVIVTVNTTPVVANAGDDFTKTCVLNPDGKQIGEASVSGFTYSWSPAAGLSATNVSNPTANPTVTTTYTVRKTNTETGCYDEDEVIVTVNTTAVVANAGDDFTKTCVLNPTGKQIGEASVSGFTYSWSPAAGLSATNVSNPTANPTVTTTYTVRKTNTETGCYDEDEVIVTVNITAVVANAGDDFTKTCVLNPAGKQIGEAPVSGFTYSWSPAAGLSTTNVSNPTANPTVTTTYTVRKTNTETGCYDEDEVIVTVNTTQVVANAGDDFTKTCVLNPDGKQIGEASVAGFTYSWSPAAGLSATNVSNPTANPTVTTTYTVRKTNTETGCYDEDEVIVTVNTTPVVANAGDDFTKTCVLNPTGKQIGEAPVSGFTYSWSPAAGLSTTNVSNPTANPTVTTTYTVRKTNTETGCYDEDEVIVTVNTTAVVANAGDDFTKTCVLNPDGKQIGETAVAGFTYSWSPAAGLSATNVSNPTANPTVTTTYTVRKTNTETGCYDEDEVIVTVNTTPVVANAGDDFTKTCVLNPDGKQIGEASVAGFTYSWTPAAGLSATNVSNPTANPTVTTTYTVRKTNTETGCYDEDEVIVTVNTTAVVANAGDDFTKTCVLNPDGKQIGETAVAGFTYSWSPAAGLSATNVSNPTANPTVTTTYTVRKTNTETGCYDEDEVIVTVNATPVVANAGDDFTKTCVLNPDGKQIGEASVAGFTYSWTPAAGLSATNVSNPTANPTVTTTYTVRKTNTETGCYDEDEVIVTVNTTQVVANAGDDFTKTCVLNPDGKQIGEASVAGFTYSWTPAAGLSATNVSNPTANPTVTTTYTVRKTNTETGCYDEDEVIVTVNTTAVVANAGDDFTITCLSNLNGRQIGEATITGFTYAWSASIGLTATNVSNPTASPTVTTTFTVIKTDLATGCYDDDEVVVTVNKMPVVAKAGYDFTKTCVSNSNGRQIGEATVAGFTYSWSPATGLSATNVSNPTANPTVTTTYTVIKTNTATGCFDDDEVVVTVNKIPIVANAGYDFAKTCVLNPNGRQIGEGTATGFTYAWSPATGLSATNVSNPTANPTVTTTYTVIKTNIATGCFDDDQVVVTVNKTPVVANAGYDFTKTCVLNPNGRQIGEAAVTGFTYSWSPATGLSATNVSNPTANPTITTTYTVIKTSTATGCFDDDQVVVTVNKTPVIANAGYDFTKTCVSNTNGRQIGEATVTGFTYAWSPATGLSATNVSNPTANPTVTTTYTVIKTNTATGCFDDDQVVVTVNKTPVVADAGYDFTKTCVSNTSGRQIGEAAVTGFTYAWSPATGLSATNVSNPTANPGVTTTYTVIKTNTATGCFDDDAVVVTVNNTAPATPVVTVTQPTCTSTSGTVKVTSPVGADYEYSNNGGAFQTSPIFSVPANTNYSIRVRKISTGCISAACPGKMGIQPTCVYYTYTVGYCAPTETFCTPNGGVKGGSSLLRRALDNMDGIVGNNAGQLYLGKSGASFAVTILDSARLSAILPGAGTATKLLGNYNLTSAYPPLNTGKISNAFLSQTVVLALNVKIPGNSLGGFILKDNYLTTITGLKTGCNAGAASCSNGGIISSLKISNNTILMNLLRNQTVDSLIRMASKALGGTLPASVTYSDISNALSVVNTSFDGGRYFMGYYATQQSCVPLAAAKVAVDQPRVVASATVDVKASPNPFTDKVSFSIMSQISGKASLDLYNVLGQKVAVVYQGDLVAGRKLSVNYQVPTISVGGLIYTLRVGDQMVTGKLVQAK